MTHEQVEKNWNTWKRANYWEHHQTWGVQGLKPQAQEHGPHPRPGSRNARVSNARRRSHDHRNRMSAEDTRAKDAQITAKDSMKAKATSR